MLALHKKDIRAVLRWCRKQSLLVLKFGRERYVMLIDFELAVDRPFIDSLKIKYPKNWQELYSAYKQRDLIKITESMAGEGVPVKTVFTPPGSKGKRFAEKIKNKMQGK